MENFIHKFMECDGIPIQRTSNECMDHLQNTLGYSLVVARGVLGLSVARGYITVSGYIPVKIYN